MFNIPLLTSCNHCREKKRKCDGEKPSCSLCRAHGVPCEYRQSRRFRKRTQTVATMPAQNIMPMPGQQTQPNGSAGFGTRPPPIAPQPAGQPNGSASTPLQPGHTFKPFTPNASVLLPGTTEQQAQQSTLPNEVNALTRLLAGDMYPQTQQLPQPILQGVNTFISPFSDSRGQIIPEWVSQQKPEAAILSNLESIASAYQASPHVSLQTSAGNLFGNLNSQLMQSGTIFQPHPFSLQQQQQQQPRQQPMPPPQMPQRPFSVSNILTPAATAGYSPATLTPQQQTLADSAMPVAYGGRRSSRMSNSTDGDNRSWASSPGSGRPMYTGPRYGTYSPSPSARSDISGPLASMYPAMPAETDRRQLHKRGPSSSGNLAANQAQKRTHYPDDFVPEVIRVYAREFPAELSPQVLLRVMRGICGNTRTSLINVDLELSWCMILKGIIPRILLFAYIASMARGQAIDQELMHLLPAKFDELCYEVATKDIPIATSSPCMWSALSLHLIGRYEFQSARYDLMMTHYEMASDVLAKTTFHGYAFPWKGVPDELKHTFEYDYYVYTFWVGFQWHLVSSFNLDRPFNVNIDPSALPIPTSSRGYFTPDLPCKFDLLSLLPKDSWPRTEQTQNVESVWFRGFDHPEYEGWRPREWREIKPNYKITLYLQRMLPLGAQLYRLQCEFSSGNVSVFEYLQRLHSQQELLKRWLYSLPEEFEITLAKVTQYRANAGTGRQPSPSVENKNLIMDFKELIMTYALYSTFIIRANRVALLGMLKGDISCPGTTMGMRVFGMRDYFEAVEQSGDCDFGTVECSMWQKNLAFHKCRMQCYESMDILCDVVQLSFIMRLDLFTYGTTYVAIAGEMLNVLISQLGVSDSAEKWKTKTRLGHALCLLRSLQHWAPALYLFVYGIQAISDPSIVIEDDGMSRRVGKQVQNSESADGSHAQGAAKQGGAEPGDEDNTGISNPFPKNHIINLIADDLDVSLAAFLAPAYPMLLLKIFASTV
ncbi:hypothetical protein GGF46_003472 [Coemansia sp. RSA 552]|nr:hypothetical protein GGF46_003472 [Coemansia sp. RSA 552]